MVKIDDLTSLAAIVSPTDGAEEILCSHAGEGGPFAVVMLKSGAIAAVWPGHAKAFLNEIQLLESGILNVYERELLAHRMQA